MELQQLRYFIAISKHRNFSRAAEECRVSQPGLSIQVQKLEKELGAPLFHRQGRTITLTSVGQRLLPKAESLLRLHSNTLDEIKDVVQSGGEALFGATLTIAPYLIPYVVSQARKADMPPFRMEENFTENLITKLFEGRLDFAIMSTPIEDPKLLVKVIAREPFVLVLPKSHALAKQQTVKLDDIGQEPFLPLSRIHCAGRQISEIYQACSSPQNAVFESVQIETILKLVEQGQGITLLPKMAVVHSLNDSLCFRSIEGEKVERKITLVQHPDRYLSESVRKMTELIQHYLNNFINERVQSVSRQNL
ncbi:LysR family transcriptional regulator [Puniceicoccaceae bacterium K14]|nr:LysR family transcriptional regulator [Puniceicoccaceae bacterium K14]